MDLDSDSVIFVDGLTNCAPDHSQLKDVRLGEKFRFNNKTWTKVSDMGWWLGVLNIRDENGKLSHIHPTTPVSRFN